MSKPRKMIAQRSDPPLERIFCQYQQKYLEKQKLKPSRSAPFRTKIRVSLKYFVNHCRLFTYFIGHLSKHP